MIKHESILVFDMDNTLVFTNQANFLSYKEAVNIILDRDITAIPPHTFYKNRIVFKDVKEFFLTTIN